MHAPDENKRKNEQQLRHREKGGETEREGDTAILLTIVQTCIHIYTTADIACVSHLWHLVSYAESPIGVSHFQIIKLSNNSIKYQKNL